MNKYVLALLVVCMLVFALVGCNTTAPQTSTTPAESTEPTTAESTEPTTAAPETRDVKLLSQNAVIEGNSYRVVYEENIQQAAAAAAEKGLNVTYNSSVSNWDAATESQQLEQAVNAGYDIILVNPVAPTGLDPIIDKALEAGITYINCDCEYYSDKILNIATDQYYLGYKAATYVGEVLGEGGKVVLINAIDGNAANEQREQGFRDAIAEKKLEIVREGNHDWDTVKAQQVMTEMLNSGVQFDGVLISQGAEAALKAYQATGTPLPKAIGFGDSGEFMQMCLEINKDSEVMPYIVISNPPGVGGSALNFGLNLMLGNELKDDIYDNPQYNSIFLESKVWYTYENQEEHRELAESTEPGSVITYWLTMDEVKDGYFK